MTASTAISNAIKTARQQKGLSRKEAAFKMTGKATRMFDSIECGKRGMNLNGLARICQALDTPLVVWIGDIRIDLT